MQDFTIILANTIYPRNIINAFNQLIEAVFGENKQRRKPLAIALKIIFSIMGKKSLNKYDGANIFS